MLIPPGVDMNTCWERLESHIQPWCGKITLWKGNNFDQGRYFFRYIWSWNCVLDEVDLGRELLLICWIILYPLCRTVDRGFNVNDRCWKVPGKLKNMNSRIRCCWFSIAGYTGPNSSGLRLKNIMNLASTSTTSSVASEKRQIPLHHWLPKSLVKQTLKLKLKHHQSSILKNTTIWDALIVLDGENSSLLSIAVVDLYNHTYLTTSSSWVINPLWGQVTLNFQFCKGTIHPGLSYQI